jgi:hypothetical protein
MFLYACGTANDMKRRKILFLLQILAALLVSINAGLGIYLNSPSLQTFLSQKVFSQQREEVSVNHLQPDRNEKISLKNPLATLD